MATRTTNKLKVGDHVFVSIAGNKRRAKVVEDRGPLGANGQQIVRIQVGDDQDARFEMRAEDLELDRQAK